MECSTFGRHVAVDAWGVDFEVLNNEHLLQAFLVEAADVCGATVLSIQSRKFEPQGATVLVMLSESHLSIHTYPDKGFAAIDCYTCGEDVDPQQAAEYLVTVLQPEKSYAKTLIRGTGEMEVATPALNPVELV
ncbi:S-adenosylmethionine decarboxylase proenzyme 2 [Paenibacillus antibioticophila]|uniref:S-adenosylmethionine decarboxylase proenzyme n=1 Tax=Paenibacillus antibioticophila TaxID=1274374 RepID=A0A919XWP6_9BACL|nr:adenosylmethionine decarboxylase [Paenibacillus antibioticophila]GIO39856.1 S-adenosylmethionine decarboxylase proenzyme 2 [Paenibacillus antibioticophila]